MASDTGSSHRPDPGPIYFTKFLIYKTRSNFYMVGKDKTRNYWKILKIDRLEPTELNIFEDSTTYSKSECNDLLRLIDQGNKSTGGLQLVTLCFGIVGFIKFLGPYYMLVITQRRKLGAICGHNVYAIDKFQMFPIPNSSVRSKMTNSKNEIRYKKLMSMVNLTKQFFFSYSYNVMHSLQKNLSDGEIGKSHYGTTFVWNSFLTKGIRSRVKSTNWTIALVYGFFEQTKIRVADKDVHLTLIARRSRLYAGTRYQRRGIDDKGNVANYVETEQLVCQDVFERCPGLVSSSVQNRGSIPLFWSQEMSRFIRPEIILSDKDPNFEATRLHCNNLVTSYGKPIIIWDLTKTHEKPPRETILRTKYQDAIGFLNESLNEENQIQFLNCDVKRLSRVNARNVMERLLRLAKDALNSTDIFYTQVSPDLGPQGELNITSFKTSNGQIRDKEKYIANLGAASTLVSSAAKNIEKSPMFQAGILRTNCIDCIDRTNTAQYAYGLVALGRQLRVMGLRESTDIELDTPVAHKLMEIYESMGNELALQYGGSPAHNKVFAELRGERRRDIKATEVMINMQRFYSNVYLDADKQDAINLFLGHFQPQEGKRALWELDSDQHSAIGRNGSFGHEIARSVLKRSRSEGNLVNEDDRSAREAVVTDDHHLSDSEYLQEIPQPSDDDISVSSLLGPHRGTETNLTVEGENFYGMDWLSSAGSSCGEEMIYGSREDYLLPRHARSNMIISPGSSMCDLGSCLEGIRAKWNSLCT